MLDVLVVGAGPAGVQAAYFLKKAGVPFELIERSSTPGSFFQTFPRHRKLISINKKHTGSSDPEFNLMTGTVFSATTICASRSSTMRCFQPPTSCCSTLRSSWKRTRSTFRMGRTYAASPTRMAFSPCIWRMAVIEAGSVIVATGFAKPRIPAIEGIEHAIDYADMSIDPADFVNKRVLVIGKGNSAFETADHLAGSAALLHLACLTPLRMAWSTHYVGNLRAVNNNILEMYQLKSQHAVLDAKIVSIGKGDPGYDVTFEYAHAQGEVETISYDVVLACAGFMLDASIFDPGMRTCARERRQVPMADECL